MLSLRLARLTLHRQGTTPSRLKTRPWERANVSFQPFSLNPIYVGLTEFADDRCKRRERWNRPCMLHSRVVINQIQ